ncbi:hypothetical protein ON010_g16446 [Phytophthora cinnamomi]|nr:hypothetical protein ON010_g16446 [Phytophthora cinnamomi]
MDVLGVRHQQRAAKELVICFAKFEIHEHVHRVYGVVQPASEDLVLQLLRSSTTGVVRCCKHLRKACFASIMFPEHIGLQLLPSGVIFVEFREVAQLCSKRGAIKQVIGLSVDLQHSEYALRGTAQSLPATRLRSLAITFVSGIVAAAASIDATLSASKDAIGASAMVSSALD